MYGLMAICIMEVWQTRVQLPLERVQVVIIRMAHQVMHVTTIQQHLLTPKILVVRMTIHGGASTPASLLPSLDPPSMTAPVPRAHSACTKTHPLPIVAKHAHKASTPINLSPLSATPVHKDFTPPSPEDPHALLALLDVTTTKPHKPLYLPANLALLVK
jgi:hypothetical protein